MYLDEALITDDFNVPMLPIAESVTESINFEKLNDGFLVLTYTTIFSVKLSFLLFFRHLINRALPMTAYWWSVTMITIVAWMLGVSGFFITCPYLDVRSLSCAAGSQLEKTLAIGGATIGLDILTDLLSMSLYFSSDATTSNTSFSNGHPYTYAMERSYKNQTEDGYRSNSMSVNCNDSDLYHPNIRLGEQRWQHRRDMGNFLAARRNLHSSSHGIADRPAITFCHPCIPNAEVAQTFMVLQTREQVVEPFQVDDSNARDSSGSIEVGEPGRETAKIAKLHEVGEPERETAELAKLHEEWEFGSHSNGR
ncbi:MAG: hypothetical protein MMC33_002865 [Icmadophila ericetorum]|nr:hypothetical protein [Icmadophila ericetorum]